MSDMTKIKSKSRGAKLKLMLVVLLITSMALSSCSMLSDFLSDIKQTEEISRPTISETEQIAETTAAPTPTPKPVPIFVKQARALESQGFVLPRKKASSYLDKIELMEILAQVYEKIAGEIDTSLMNPEYGANEGIRKLIRIGLYYDDTYYDQEQNTRITYSDASYWLSELRRKRIQNSAPRTDQTAYPQDLLPLINISSALYGWKPGDAEAINFSLDDLLLAEMSNKADQPLTRQTA